jgi:hypothetical protein
MSLFASPAPGSWEGSANKLEHRLTTEDSGVKREAAALLTFPTPCGTYLGRLRKPHPKRFELEHTRKGNVWTVRSK